MYDVELHLKEHRLAEAQFSKKALAMMDCDPVSIFEFGRPLQSLRLWAAVNKLSCSSSIHDKTLEQWLEQREQYELLGLIRYHNPEWLTILTDDPQTTLSNRDWSAAPADYDRLYSRFYPWGDD